MSNAVGKGGPLLRCQPLGITEPARGAVHPAAGDDSFIRSANGTIGQLVAIDAATGWIQVESAQRHVSVV